MTNSRVRDAIARVEAGLPVTERAPALRSYLETIDVVSMFDFDERSPVLDLEAGSMMLGEPLSDLSVERFSQLIDRHMRSAQATFAFGRWAERRDVYRSDLFLTEPGQPMRDVHLGVDVFCAIGTPVIAPLSGTVHICAINEQELDYGPLLILEHQTDSGLPFYSLYGHLAAQSTARWVVGQRVEAGETIATVGAPPENGNWPPHLHFQLILDLLDLGRDFPGVAAHAGRDVWLALSPLPARFFPERHREALDASRGSLART